MEITYGGGSFRSGVHDTIMKVAQYHDHEKTVVVNVSELAKEILSAVSNIVDCLATKNDLPHLQGSIGIPDFVTLEKNIVDQLKKWNVDCIDRFSRSNIELVKERVVKLAQEIGVEVEEAKTNQQKSSAPHHYAS